VLERNRLHAAQEAKNCAQFDAEGPSKDQIDAPPTRIIVQFWSSRTRPAEVLDNAGIDQNEVWGVVRRTSQRRIVTYEAKPAWMNVRLGVLVVLGCTDTAPTLLPKPLGVDRQFW
jgi:hypothetical protein